MLVWNFQYIKNNENAKKNSWNCCDWFKSAYVIYEWSPRKTVMRQVLSDLRYLTSSDHAHLWTASNVESLLAFAEKSVGEEGEAIVGALSIFCDLVKNTSISKLQPLNADSSIIKLTQQCSYSTQLTVAGRATQVFFLIKSQYAVWVTQCLYLILNI